MANPAIVEQGDPFPDAAAAIGYAEHRLSSEIAELARLAGPAHAAAYLAAQAWTLGCIAERLAAKEDADAH